jgi:hypothetical protein
VKHLHSVGANVEVLFPAAQLVQPCSPARAVVVINSYKKVVQ